MRLKGIIVVWEGGKHGTMIGKVGKMRVASIQMSVEKRNTYVCYIDLPGLNFRPNQSEVTDVKEAKLKCERAVHHWFTEAGLLDQKGD